MVSGQHTTPESLLQTMEKQLLDLINGDDTAADSLLVATPEIEMREMHGKGKDIVVLGNGKEATVKRRGSDDFSEEFSDNDEGSEEEDYLDSNSQSRKNISKILLDYSLIVDNPEKEKPDSCAPLKNVFSDEISLSSLGSQIEGILTPSPAMMKYNASMVSTSGTSTSHTAASSQDDSASLALQSKPTTSSNGCSETSSMDIHDAVDAIREEASKMEAAFAIDRLQTMEGELNSIKKLLHAQTDQIDLLKKEVRSKDETLAILRLERDLIKADMEAYEVSGRLTSRSSHPELPVSPSSSAFTPLDPKSPPVLSRCNTNRSTSLDLQNEIIHENARREEQQDSTRHRRSAKVAEGSSTQGQQHV